MFQGGDELPGFEQAFVGASVQPGVASAHDLDVELALLQVQAVQVGDFVFAPGGGLEALGQVDDLVVVEVQAGDRVAGLGGLGLFFQGQDAALGIEFGNAVALGVVHVVGEDAGALRAGAGVAQQFMEVVAVEDVVAQHKGRGGVADEVLANHKGLRQAVGAGLHGVLQVQAPLAAVAQQLLKAWRVLRGADDQDVADARQHEGAQRVVNHGLVVHRQQLLADGQGGRVQARAGAAGQDDAFALGGGGGHVGRVRKGAWKYMQTHGTLQPVCLQDFGQHALNPGLPVRQGEAEGGLQLGGVQTRVMGAHGGGGEGAGGHGRNFFSYDFYS